MEAWHYMNNARISGIIVVANEGYVFQDFKELIKGFREKEYPGCKWWWLCDVNSCSE